MTALHELYLSVKAEVEGAVAAVNAALTTAGQYTEDAIVDALSAINADDVDFFGWVGQATDDACKAIVDGLGALADALDDNGHGPAYMQTFNAAALYGASKDAYDGFTGGHGGQSSGAGSSGGWFGTEPKNYPLYTCHNRNGAKLNVMGKDVAPTDSQIDYTVILGACSEVFVYLDQDNNSAWENGIYQFVRWRVLLWFWDKDCWVNGDYGAEPQYLNGLPGSSSVHVVTDNSAQAYFVDGMVNLEDEWGGIGPVMYWPISTAWQIYDDTGESEHDRNISVVGRYELNGHNYWLYNESYWFASHQAAYRDANNQPISNGNPDQVLFVKICDEEPTPGKNIKPWAPWAIFLSVGDEEEKKKLAKALRLGLDLRPYEVMCNRQKILCDGQQVTCGDPEGA